MYVYIYIYTHIHTYASIYIYIYTHNELNLNTTHETSNIQLWAYHNNIFRICTNSLAATVGGANLEVDLLSWDVAGKDFLCLCLPHMLYPSLSSLSLS